MSFNLLKRYPDLLEIGHMSPLNGHNRSKVYINATLKIMIDFISWGREYIRLKVKGRLIWTDNLPI